MKLSLVTFLLVLSFAACQSDIDIWSPSKKLVIHIQPFGDFPAAQTQQVYAHIKRLHPDVVIKAALPLPKTALNVNKTRYRADSLIRYLRDLTPKGEVTIGLTQKDISSTEHGIADWGVLGLGYQPGKSCVVSTFRLSKKNKTEQLKKVAVHELGHTRGLPHCKVKTCFMRDGEGKNHTNEETGFCELCAAKLKKAGFML